VVSRGRLNLRTSAALKTPTSTTAPTVSTADSALNHADAELLVGASATVAIDRVLK
jgi:hypothetical protein